MSAVAASNRNASSSGQTSQTLWGRLPGVSIGNQALIGALAGGFAGGVTNALLYPLDTVKTKLQLRGAEQLYSGPIDVVRKVIEKEGVRGLLAGAQAGVFGAMLSSALYFGAYETAKGALSTPVRVRVRVRRPAAGALAQSRPAQGEGKATGKGGKAKAAGGKGPQAPALVASVTELGGEGDEWETRPLVRPALVPPLAAFLGNIASSLILVPKEVVKQQLQAEGGAGGSALGLARAILRTEGVRGLYRGYASTILRNAPGNVISFSGYELLKQLQLDRLPPGSVLPPLVNMGTGFVAGAVAAVSTQPLDLVKTRLMTQGLRPSGLQMYRGVLHTIRTVVREEGLRGLSRGLGTRLVFTASFNAIGFPVFEAAKGRLVRALRDQHSGAGLADAGQHAGVLEGGSGKQQQQPKNGVGAKNTASRGGVGGSGVSATSTAATAAAPTKRAATDAPGWGSADRRSAGGGGG